MADTILGVEVRHDLGYDRVALPAVDGHQLFVEKGTFAVGRYIGTCSCGEFVARNRCAACLERAFNEHLAGHR